jgi:hypothetical protein
MTPPIEDLLRQATRDAAAEIDSVGPLSPETLTRPRGRRDRARGRSDSRAAGARWPLAVPLAAAAAVVAVAGLSVALPRLLGGAAATSPTAKVTSGTGRGAAPGPSTGPKPASSGTVPAYYATLTGTRYPWYDNPEDITIRSTYSGQVLATLTPGSAGFGTFGLVAAGAADDEFVVGAQPWDPVSDAAYTDNDNAAPMTFLLLRFDPATRQVNFTRLPGPAVPAGDIEGVALSPDGTRLAVAAQVSSIDIELDVYSVATGAVRTWSMTGPRAAGASFGDGGASGPDALSWRPGGHTLAFDWTGPVPGGSSSSAGLRLLDTSQPGGSLLADSHAVFTLSRASDGGFYCTDVLVLSPDGTTVSCAGSDSPNVRTGTPVRRPIPPNGTQVTVSPGSVTYGFGEFSVATGKLVTVLDPTVDPSAAAVSQQLYWTDGSALIGTLDGPVFVFAGGQARTIPWAPDISPAQGATNDAAW